MTVINAMKFNGKEGGMVADSQSSNHMRKYDLADKIVFIESEDGTTNCLVGTAGAADICFQAGQELKEQLATKPSFSVQEVARTLSEITVATKRRMINDYLISEFGIDASSALSGHAIVGGKHVPLEGQIREKVASVVSGQVPALGQLFHSGFIVLGSDAKAPSIYNLAFGEMMLLGSHPYASIGSGADESDKVLYQFLKSKRREERSAVGLVEGMAALIRATSASSDFNKGVGGVPTISYFSDSKTVVLREDESRLATEIVKVADAGFVNPKAAYGVLDQILTKEARADKVNKDFFRASPKYHKMMDFLRGYHQ
jgi:hypothetical protein